MTLQYYSLVGMTGGNWLANGRTTAFQLGHISRLLGSNAKRKVEWARPRFLARARTLWEPGSLYLAAVDSLRPSFPAASAREMDVLVSHLLGRVARAESNGVDLTEIENDPNGKVDSMSELGEMESLRLQMAMDRSSKSMQTLSNILKKISDTDESIVQKLK